MPNLVFIVYIFYKIAVKWCVFVSNNFKLSDHYTMEALPSVSGIIFVLFNTMTLF